ncbi:aminotransferase class V-fold PLP-dependent enzyme [Anaerococcus sp.]|uniref:aminotransferase class V-fold PLP-dependent enzyme n=1 Tax=Anaerococcus sp. TaxID=1872515 RepID=UPI002A75E115|nr:aminotransferase class V-fold PLP-dependent enzyme [Anaerococcus sp.]MDY2928652.1 aminotransferase class V-fold PLP-dependent enzyme [Anaerococcus sp.]
MYFDNAATTIHKPKAVTDKLVEVISSGKFGNPSRSGHMLAQNSMMAIFDTKKSLARLCHIENPSDILLTANATFALNFAIKSLVNRKDHVITSTTEHNSILRPLYQTGADISFVDFDEDYELRYQSLPQLLRKNTKFLVINSASNILGDSKDLDRLYDFARENELIMIVDTAQSLGLIDINMGKYENSLFAFTGHKSLYGPSGTGGLIKNGDFAFDQVFAGGSGIDSFRKTMPPAFPQIFEAGTANFLGQIALKAGVDFILDEGIDKINKKVRELASSFYRGIKDIPWLRFYSKDPACLKTGLVSFNIGNIPSDEISLILDEDYNIQTRPGAHCAPLIHKHLGTEKQGIVRFSFSYFNTSEEVYKAIHALREISQRYK